MAGGVHYDGGEVAVKTVMRSPLNIWKIKGRKLPCLWVASREDLGSPLFIVVPTAFTE